MERLVALGRDWTFVSRGQSRLVTPGPLSTHPVLGLELNRHHQWTCSCQEAAFPPPAVVEDLVSVRVSASCSFRIFNRDAKAGMVAITFATGMSVLRSQPDPTRAL